MASVTAEVPLYDFVPLFARRIHARVLRRRTLRIEC